MRFFNTFLICLCFIVLVTCDLRLPPDHITEAIRQANERKNGKGITKPKQQTQPVHHNYDNEPQDDYGNQERKSGKGVMKQQAHPVHDDYDNNEQQDDDYDNDYYDADGYYDDYDDVYEYDDYYYDNDYYEEDDDDYDYNDTVPEIVPANMAIVFSWHRNVKLGDSRWQGGAGKQSIGVGNEFKVAVLSVTAALPGVPVYLFTNVPKSEIDRDVVKLITVVKVDLFVEAGLHTLMDQRNPPYERIGFGTKPMSLIYGWERDLLPPYVLYLDVDIIVAGDEDSAGRTLADVFKPLLHYDLAAVFEGFAIGPRPTPAMGDGWEINTGVMSVRRDALPLVKKWLEVFKRDQDSLDRYISGEQQALMIALEEYPWYRPFPLSSIFNFRRPTVLPQLGFKGMPALVQAHVYSDMRTNVREYKSVAKHVAAVVLEDGLHHVSKQGGPVHYLCDVIVG